MRTLVDDDSSVERVVILAGTTVYGYMAVKIGKICTATMNLGELSFFASPHVFEILT